MSYHFRRDSKKLLEKLHASREAKVFIFDAVDCQNKLSCVTWSKVICYGGLDYKCSDFADNTSKSSLQKFLIIFYPVCILKHFHG